MNKHTKDGLIIVLSWAAAVLVMVITIVMYSPKADAAGLLGGQWKFYAKGGLGVDLNHQFYDFHGTTTWTCLVCDQLPNVPTKYYTVYNQRQNYFKSGVLGDLALGVTNGKVDLAVKHLSDVADGFNGGGITWVSLSYELDLFKWGHHGE